MAYSKPKLDLDPSPFVYYFAGDEPDKMAVIRRFFETEVASGKV